MPSDCPPSPSTATSTTTATTATGRATPDSESDTAVSHPPPECDKARSVRLVGTTTETGVRGADTSHQHCQCVEDISAVIDDSLRDQVHDALLAGQQQSADDRSQAAEAGHDESAASWALSEDQILSRVTDAMVDWENVYREEKRKVATARPESAGADSTSEGSSTGRFLSQWESRKRKEDERFKFAVRSAVALARDRGPADSPAAEDSKAAAVGPGSPEAHACRPVLPPSAKKGAIPCPGKTFIITDAKFEYALSLCDGALRFVELEVAAVSGNGGCYVWHCVENKYGWLGFRNAASGTYIGHQKSAELHAFEKHHHGWEHMCLRQVEGGYVLLIQDGDNLFKIGVRGKKDEAELRGLNATKEEPMVWQFIEV